MLSGQVGVERHGDDIVGGVASGGQGAAALAGLVDGRQVTHPLGDVLSLDGLQPHLMEREREREETEGATRLLNLRLPHLPSARFFSKQSLPFRSCFTFRTFDKWNN